MTVARVVRSGHLSSSSSSSSSSKKLIITVLVLLLATITFLRNELAVLSSLNRVNSFYSSFATVKDDNTDNAATVSLNTTSTNIPRSTNSQTESSESSIREDGLARKEMDKNSDKAASSPLLHNAPALPALDQDTIAQLLHNSSIISIHNLSTSAQVRRSQLQLADVNTEFLADLRLVHFQLSYDYDPTLSNCNRLSYRKMAMNGCFGLGTQVGRFNRKMLRRMRQRRNVFGDIDTFTCGWFERDQTKDCKSMFGDCYFPSLTTRGRQMMMKTNANETMNISATKTCYDIKWFEYKYGQEALYAAHFSWLLGDDPPPAVPAKQPEPQPCIALHIRRGDACINADRKCFSYNTYYRAVQFMVQRYPHLQRLVVLTDGDDFPLEQFQSLIPTIDYPTTVNRSKYNVQHLRNESIDVWVPEHRNLDNATSELLDEVAQASQCTALVGTLTAGVSKWIWMLHLTRQGRVPLFYSLQGCTRNIWESGDYMDEGCEGPLF